MKEKINATVVNPLRNVKVEVRFVPKENSRIKDPKHVMYGDMNENAKIKLSVPKLTSGQYVNVLTDDEKRFFEELFGFEAGAMSVYNKKDNYWSDANPNTINTVTLTKRPIFLDLSVPDDYIRYKILKANKDVIASSLSDLRKYHKATYQFVLVEESEERETSKKELNATMNAFMKLGQIIKDHDKLKFIVETINNSSYANDTSDEFLQLKAQEIIQKNANAFLAVVEDPLLDAKILIKRGVAAGVVSIRGNYFYLTEGDVPLCSKGQEPVLNVAAQYINLPKNQEIKYLIEAKLNQ